MVQAEAIKARITNTIQIFVPPVNRQSLNAKGQKDLTQSETETIVIKENIPHKIRHFHHTMNKEGKWD